MEHPPIKSKPISNPHPAKHRALRLTVEFARAVVARQGEVPTRVAKHQAIAQFRNDAAFVDLARTSKNIVFLLRSSKC